MSLEAASVYVFSCLCVAFAFDDSQADRRSLTSTLMK